MVMSLTFNEMFFFIIVPMHDGIAKNVNLFLREPLDLIRPRNPRPLDVVRDNWLCLLSAQWYLQILSCPNNHNKGETYEQISKAITCTMALPIP